MKSFKSAFSLVAGILILFGIVILTENRIPTTESTSIISKEVLKNPNRPELRQVIEGRGEHEFLMTHDPKTNTIPKERILEAKTYTEQLLNRRGPIPGINWNERGPNNVSGRTRAIMIDAADPTGNTAFAGGVGGGIWKTTDGGDSWTQIDDFFENMAIGSIVQDPNDPDIIYFGTGEGYGNFDSIRGLGIWKSTDGGDTFTQLASTNNSSFYFVNHMVAIDAGASTILLAATSVGVQRSTNDGISWSIPTNGNGNAVDLTLASNNDVYAALDGDGIYKSTNNGSSFTEVYNNAFTEGRIELAAAPSNNNVVYALIEFIGSGGVPTIRRTTDGGASWPLRTNPVWEDQNCGVPNPDWTRTQDWYDLIAAVDPNNSNRVFIGGVDLFVTSNGGSSWTQISGWASSCGRQFVHADQHELVFAGNSNVLWNGNDGGVFKTTNATAAIPDFEFKGTGFNITQFYASDLHPDANEDYFLAGSQDNGTQRFTEPGLNNTTSASGGDGGFCHIDQDNSLIQITSFTRNNYNISTDGGATFGAGPRINSGLFINPTDYDDDIKKLYCSLSSGFYLRWEDPSTGGNTTTNVSVNTLIGSTTHVKVSDNVNDRVYFGTQFGRVVRVDGASTGTSNTGTIIFDVSSGTISSVAIEEGNEDHMIITLSNYGVISVYESTNATAGTPTWVNIEGNLPDMPVRWAIFHPLNNDQVFLATELGVWGTDNLNGVNTDWAPTNNNLSNTRIDMLKSRTSDNLIIAGTHGRGLFSSASLTDELLLEKSVVGIGNALDTLEYTITITSNKLSAQTNVVIKDTLDSRVEYVTGSLTCGSISGNVITINQGTVNPGDIITCTFQVVVPVDSFTTSYFLDDIESGASIWTTINIQGAGNWTLSNAMPNSPSTSWYTPNTGTENNTQFLELDQMALMENSVLSFYHKYDTEANWDGGFVEISTNGGANWTDLGPNMIMNEYNSQLGNGSNANIAGRGAFSGNSGGYIQTLVDLSSFGTQNVRIRFGFGEDNNTNVDGWYVDDVELLAGFFIENEVCLTSTEGEFLTSKVTTLIFECMVDCARCDDGIRNGSETGVDCGGEACVPCDCTEDSITYDNETIPDGTDEFVKTTIDAINGVNVLNGSSVSLKAGVQMEIDTGFNIENGALIEVIIDDCNEVPSGN